MSSLEHDISLSMKKPLPKIRTLPPHRTWAQPILRSTFQPGTRQAQIDTMTRNLLNEIVPEQRAFNAFSEAPRYHAIINPLPSPRDILLNRIPSNELPTPDIEWNTRKPAPISFDDSLQQWDQRLFKSIGKNSYIARTRDIEEEKYSPIHTTLPLSPRPKTSSDVRVRKEVLQLLEVERNIPKGIQYLAAKIGKKEGNPQPEILVDKKSNIGDIIHPTRVFQLRSPRPQTMQTTRQFSQSQSLSRSMESPRKKYTHTRTGTFPTHALSVTKLQPPIDTPHRILPPTFMNTPIRTDFILDSKRSKDTSPRPDIGIQVVREHIRDYIVRASACRRAGRRQAEANTFYCMGVLWDNIGEYGSAIECYEQFRKILNSAEDDKFAESLAQNSIGVSYQYMKSYEIAIYHHTLHRDITDISGQFIAYTNLGIIYNILNNTEQAALNHQHALRCAIQMSSLTAQSISIGNLGLTGILHGDYVTARACMERHLTLCESLDDYRAQITACLRLGDIASRTNDHLTAVRRFEQAMTIAQAINDISMVDQAKVQMGVASANLQMDAKLKQIGERLKSRGRDPGTL